MKTRSRRRLIALASLVGGLLLLPIAGVGALIVLAFGGDLPDLLQGIAWAIVGAIFSVGLALLRYVPRFWGEVDRRIKLEKERFRSRFSLTADQTILESPREEEPYVELEAMVNPSALGIHMPEEIEIVARNSLARRRSVVEVSPANEAVYTSEAMRQAANKLSLLEGSYLGKWIVGEEEGMEYAVVELSPRDWLGLQEQDVVMARRRSIDRLF